LRDCSNFDPLDNKYIRISVRSRRENRILLKELSELCQAS
jgi:histidinol-phosphate/aromatic aminotransferase/cobyric acid decarboxylase-like protein